jgi:small subunit ribosomal protein S19
MGRSLKKGPFVHPKLLKKVARLKAAGSREPLRTWSRASMVIPEFVNLTFLVHDGRNFRRVFITEDMVGHRLGEFAPTRTFRGHARQRKAAS